MKRIKAAWENHAFCRSSPLVVAYSHGNSFLALVAPPFGQAGTQQIDRAPADFHRSSDELRNLRIGTIRKGL
jgi:hypothetical protein